MDENEQDTKNIFDFHRNGIDIFEIQTLNRIVELIEK